MVDDATNTDTAPVAPAVASPVTVEATPSPEAPVAPAVETPNVETPETPATEPVTETPAPAEAAKSAETLLGGEKKAEASGEAADPETPSEEPTEETKPAEEAPAEEVTLPGFEPFTLPEGVELEADRISEFTKELGEFEITTKASHEEVQKLGQKMLDKYVAEQQRFVESLTHAWEKQKTDWKDSFLKDPEYTNRTDTVVNAAIDAIGIYAGDAKQQDEFRNLMETTGVGNHPAMIRLLSNIMLAKAEPKPLAAPLIATPAKSSKIQRMYGTKK